jgi:integrase
METLLLTVEETAEALNIGREAVYDLMRMRELTSVKTGRSRRVPAECLREYVTRIVRRRRGMSPRSRDEGSGYKRTDGRWAGATYVHNRTGGRQRRQVYGKSKEEVAAKLAALRVMTANGIPAAAVKWTVRTYGNHWLTHVAAPSVKPATLSNYQWVLTRHVYPVVGSVRLTSLAPMHVGQMLAVLETGFSPRTAQLSKAVLRAMLAEAMRDQLVQRNVAMLVRGPRVER